MRIVATKQSPAPRPGSRSHLARPGIPWAARFAIAAGFGLGFGFGGCSSSDREATHPVGGRVVIGGEPAAGAFVVFHRVSASAPVEDGNPSAQVRSDGSFALTTFDEDDGAPAGDYAVTVEWRKLVVNGTEALPGPDVVPKEYRRPETTPLKVTVVAGENPPAEFEIEAGR